MVVEDKKSEWMKSILIERTIKYWDDFNKFVSTFSIASPASLNFIFRGQARADWPLIPSFARYAIAAGLDATKALTLEAVALREFRKQAHLYLPSQMIQPAHDLVAWWTLMQHYNAPTRMLDWTISPFVAAYFAINHEPDHPGAVWIVRRYTIQEYMKKTYKVRYPPMVDDSKEAFLKADAQPILYSSLPLIQTDRMGAQKTLFTVSAQILADHGKISRHYRGPVIPWDEAVIKAGIRVGKYGSFDDLNPEVESIRGDRAAIRTFKDTVRRCVYRAIKRGLIERQGWGKNNTFTVTAKGRQWLETQPAAAPLTPTQVQRLVEKLQEGG